MSASTEAIVRSDTADGALTLTLDSPHNRNALSDELVSQLSGGLDTAAQDESVRCVVLTHTGGTFCAGADLSAASDRAVGDPARARADQLIDLLRAIVTCPKPVIARLDGHVRAGGTGLVAACDIAIAGPATTFALTEVRLGLAASAISLVVLPRTEPRAAARYFLTGETFDAPEAARIGLLTESVATPQELDNAVERVRADLARCSPVGLLETKALITQDLLSRLDARRDDAAEQSSRLFAGEEAHEGMAAFLERRSPRWAR